MEMEIENLGLVHSRISWESTQLIIHSGSSDLILIDTTLSLPSLSSLLTPAFHPSADVDGSASNIHPNSSTHPCSASPAFISHLNICTSLLHCYPLPNHSAHSPLSEPVYNGTDSFPIAIQAAAAQLLAKDSD